MAHQPATEEHWIYDGVHERRPDPWVATPHPYRPNDNRADRHWNGEDNRDPAHVRPLHAEVTATRPAGPPGGHP
jgi:hypothetical protein